MWSNIQRRLAFAVIPLSVIAAPTAKGQVIDEDVKLTAFDAAPFDLFGHSIAIGNGIVAVGAHNDDDLGSNSGSASLFDASTGAQISKLLPNDGALNARFGWSVATDNGIVAVGANGDSHNGILSGSAYLLEASTGAQVAKLIASDRGGGDQFGYSIAIANGVVAVGSRNDDDNGTDSGSAYTFDASSGLQIVKLLPTDGAGLDNFGYSIDIDNGTVAVGAPLDGDNGTASGSAYLFDASTGAQLLKLLPNDGAVNARFGWSIAIDSGIVAVGAQATNDSGSAYLFDASTGAQLFKLLPSNGAAANRFGQSIDISDGIVAVGASFDSSNGSASGSAFLFDVSTGAQIANLLPTDGAAFDEFGWSVAIDDGIVAVGAFGDDDNGSASGSAYLFDVSAPCPPDLNGDSVLDFFDLLAFLDAFSAGDSVADFVADGLLDFFDVLAFLQAFATGCP